MQLKFWNNAYAHLFIGFEKKLLRRDLQGDFTFFSDMNFNSHTRKISGFASYDHGSEKKLISKHSTLLVYALALRQNVFLEYEKDNWIFMNIYMTTKMMNICFDFLSGYQVLLSFRQVLYKLPNS